MVTLTNSHDSHNRSLANARVCRKMTSVLGALPSNLDNLLKAMPSEPTRQDVLDISKQMSTQISGCAVEKALDIIASYYNCKNWHVLSTKLPKHDKDKPVAEEAYVLCMQDIHKKVLLDALYAMNNLLNIDSTKLEALMDFNMCFKNNYSSEQLTRMDMLLVSVYEKLKPLVDHHRLATLSKEVVLLENLLETSDNPSVTKAQLSLLQDIGRNMVFVMMGTIVSTFYDIFDLDTKVCEGMFDDLYELSTLIKGSRRLESIYSKRLPEDVHILFDIGQVIRDTLNPSGGSLLPAANGVPLMQIHHSVSVRGLK
jgi:hypothetical protein